MDDMLREELWSLHKIGLQEYNGIAFLHLYGCEATRAV